MATYYTREAYGEEIARLGEENTGIG